MLDLTAEQESILGVAEAIKYETDGRRLRRDLVKELKRAIEPALPEIRSGLMGMSTAGLGTVSPRLRTAVLRKLTIKTSLSGTPRVRVSISKRGMPRGFNNAPKRLNRSRGWRHPVFGQDVWVSQRGEPDYFDRPLRQRRDEARQAVQDAVEAMRERVRRGAR
jgi:hypothetical protein